MSFRLSKPGSLLADVALGRVAIFAHQRRDPLLAADDRERAILNTLDARQNFQNPRAYIQQPGLACLERIQGLLAAGKVAEALPLLARAEEIQPGFPDLAVAVVPSLERLGRKKEADELFARTIAVHENVLRRFSHCAAAHDAIARVSAGCRRNLDSALEHAQKAVELAPENPADFLDTLAKVYFQRGEQARAIESQKKATQLEPLLTVYRQRLWPGRQVAVNLPRNTVKVRERGYVTITWGGGWRVSAGYPLPFAEDEGD